MTGAWFNRFSSALRELGFHCSKADTSMFIRSSVEGTIILLLYVDDMVLTGSNLPLLPSFVASLQSQFVLKDLGDLHCFRGIEVHRTRDTIQLTQIKHMTELLKHANMIDAKPLPSPILAGPKL